MVSRVRRLAGRPTSRFIVVVDARRPDCLPMGHTLGALHLRRRRAMSPASQATDHSLPAAKTRPLDHLSLRKGFGTLNGAFQAFSRISGLIKGHTAIQISGDHGFKFRQFGIFPNFRFSRFWLKYKLFARGSASRFPNFGITDMWTRFPITLRIGLSIRNDRKIMIYPCWHIPCSGPWHGRQRRLKACNVCCAAFQ